MAMGLLRKNFLSNQSGQVAVIFALVAVPLLAVTSAAVDYTQLTKEDNHISNALDAAVLAAANNNLIGLSEKAGFAETHFRANYSGALDLTLTPSITSNSVRLHAEGEVPLTFGNVIGIKNPTISEASAATISTENTICVLALSKDADGAISYDSDMEFTANNCAVHTNSKSGRAIIAEMNVNKPTAKSFCAVGGVDGKVEPHSKGECSPIADPYEGVTPARVGVCEREFRVENSFLNQPSNPYTTPSAPIDYTSTTTTGSQGQGTPWQYANGQTGNAALPAVNPVSLEDLALQLIERDPTRLMASAEEILTQAEFALKVQALSGNDMSLLLDAYDDYGESLDCGGDPRQGCYGFNNPFLNLGPDESPKRSLVADIFDISYGAFVTPNNVPDIVTQGVVELVNGQLYSRNNLDNELIAVSPNLTGGNIVLTPGTYCGGLTVDGMRVRFSPGDYIFKDGPLTFLNNSEANADNVTFGFMGAGATMNVESGSKLKIKAATSGPRKGLAFMQMIDPWAPGNRAKTTGVNRIASGGSVSMSGTAYFPEQTLMISGEDSHIGADSPAVGLIADTIEFRGRRGSRVELNVDHVKAGIPPIEPRADDGVRLIE